MLSTTFEIDLADGFARPARRSPSARSVRWSEQQLQHVVVLNPALLRIAGHVPLELTGGSTSRSPDQAYVDPSGRLVVVEVKNERAGLPALAQLLSYAEHWRLTPLGEMQPRFASLARYGQAGVLADALRSVSALAGRSAGRAGACDPPDRWTSWPKASTASLRAFTEGTWGANAATVTGAPARSVLVAPAFDDGVLEFARAFNERKGQIELVQASFWRPAPRRLGIAWTPLVTPDPAVEMVWTLAARIWQNSAIRAAFAINGWADSLNGSYFSFSCRRAPKARFWIGGDPKSAELFTVVPDKWYAGSARLRLRQQFLAALPGNHGGGRWIQWNFSFPRQAKQFDASVARVASAISEILAPAQP